MAAKEKTLMGRSGAAANGLLNNYLPLVYPYTRAALNPYEDIGEVEAAIEQSWQDYPLEYGTGAVAGTVGSMFGPMAYLKYGGKALAAGVNAAKAKGVMEAAGLIGKFAPKAGQSALGKLATVDAMKMAPQVGESLLATATPILKKPGEEKMGEFDLGKRVDMVTDPLNLLMGAFGTTSGVLANRAERQAFDTLKAGAKVNNRAFKVPASSPISANSVGRKMLDGGYWQGLPGKLLDKAGEEVDSVGGGVGGLVDEASDVATQAGLTMNRKNIIDYLQRERDRLFGGVDHVSDGREGFSIFNDEIERIKNADPKTIRQWWKEKTVADNKFDKTSVYSNYAKALSRAVRGELDNVTGELGNRSKAGLLQTPDITQYTMAADGAEQAAPHLQRLDGLLGGSRAVAPVNRSVAPLVDGAMESLGASDDVINMVKGVKPGTPLNYDVGKYTDSARKYSTMKVIEDALSRNAAKSMTDTRNTGLGKTFIGGLIGDFSYGLKNNKPKYSAKGIDILSKAAKNSKVGNALWAQEYGDRYIPTAQDAAAEQNAAQEVEQSVEQDDGPPPVGYVHTTKSGKQMRFKGGDDNDKNNWEQIQ